MSSSVTPSTRINSATPRLNPLAAQNSATIALSTSSPLVAKYMNLNNNQNINITEDKKVSFSGVTTSSPISNISSNNSPLDNNNKVLTTFTNSTTSTTSTISQSFPLTTTTTINNTSSTSIYTTSTKSTIIGSALNPDSYLSAKLNQNRVAREAFLRGGGSSTATVNTSSTGSVNNTNTTYSNSNYQSSQMMNSSVTSEKSINNTSFNTTSSLNNSTSIVNPSSVSGLSSTTTIVTNSHKMNGIAEKTANLIASLAPKQQQTPSTSSPITESSSQLYQNLMPSLVKSNSQNTDSQPSTPNGINIKTRTLDGYVGFANLPNQVYRKSVKKGFEFNLMIIGETGLGKSTFVNSLFLTELYNPADFPGTHERKKKTTHVDSTTVMLSEKGVNLRLAIVDTPGFGESVDNSNCWQPIVEYIDSKYEEYLAAESRVNRKPIIDNRIHTCLYFIAPGHSLKQLDIEVMKKLHDRVNLIPIIAKADTMTQEEIKNFKKVVLQEINLHKIQIYEFPDVDDDDVEMSKTNNLLKSKLPFAVVGSNTVIDVDGKQCRGRQYPWGVVNIDDLNHCDFMALRTMLIRTHMQDLKDVTNNVHYENYRFKKLAQVTGDKTKLNTSSNKNPFQQLEEERKEAEARLDKMKYEMEAVFEQKVKEKLLRLKESEANLEKQQETMKASLEKEEKELEAQRVAFQREKQIWEEQNKEDEEKFKLTLDKDPKKG